MKYILKSLFLTSLCASAYAARDDCKELGSVLSSEAMPDCKVNANGEMTELTYNTFDDSVTDEGYKKALSYPTLKKLNFEDEYGNCKQLTYGLSNLANLEELNIKSFRGDLAPNTLKGLNSLKKFSYDTGDSSTGSFSNQNIEELSTLANLESLTFGYTSLGELSPLQKLTKVTSLTLDSNGKGGMDVEGCLANLKNLKELAVTYDIKNQSEVDAIASYANLEKLTVEFRKGEINCDNLKNLTKLHTLDLTIEGETEAPSCVKAIPKLAKLTFNGKDVPLNNGNTVPETTTAPGATGEQTTSVPGTTVNGNTTATDNLDLDSGASSIVINALTMLPVLGVALKMLL